MLTQALRKVGIDDPHEIAQERMEQLVEIPKDIQAKLLPPLLEAMSDVIDGVGSAKHDLAQALFEIREAGTETERNKQYGREAYEKLNALPHEDKINLMAHVDDLKSSVNMRFMQTSLRNMANIAVLVTIDEYYKDCLAGNVDAMLKKIEALDKNRLAIIANFFDRYPWIPPFFEDLARRNAEAAPLFSIINDLDVTSHERLGLPITTSATEDHKADFNRYQGIAMTEGPWHALYTFFGIPGEPAELPG
jgi:hypothetical protein